MTSTTYTLRTTDFHDLVVVAHPSGEYTARLDASSVVIACDGVWVGTGVWDSEGRNIVGCAADLPDEVYTALDAGVAQLALRAG